MTLITIAIAACTLFMLAVVVSWILGWANIQFRVEVDPKVEQVLEALPGANCGGCGYMGCSDYAVAIVTDDAPTNKCPVGGQACAVKVAQIMGVKAAEIVRSYAVVHCGSHYDDRVRTAYRGEKRCVAASQVAGVQGCTYGCLGFGDCVQACNYDAVHVVDGLAAIDYEKCIGCGACTKVCPRGIIDIVIFREISIPAVACSNKDKGKDSKAVCKTSCIGCKACTKFSDIFVVEENLSQCNSGSYKPELHDDVLKAVDKCPTKCIKFLGTG